MRIKTIFGRRAQSGSAIIGYFVVMLIAISGLAALSAHLAQTTSLAHRRNDMTAALMYAEGAVVLGCWDLNYVLTNSASSMVQKFRARGYEKNNQAGGPHDVVYERTVTSPYTNQTVTLQIWYTNSSSPTAARVLGVATVGKVTQRAVANVRMGWGYAAAIISTNPGTRSTTVAKSAGTDGNVAVDGDKLGPTIVDGGEALAIWANGRANVDPLYAIIPKTAISMTNYGTSGEIPDYTAQGTANTLFDFGRFIAVAEKTPNLLNTNTGNNHFTNLATFLVANKKAVETSPAKAMEGVIVVDIPNSKDPGIAVLDSPDKYPAYVPGTNGIRVKGTLFFNFGPSFGPTDKVFNRLPMNINPADLSSFNSTNSTTYVSGYPPTYYDESKQAWKINITSRGYDNFSQFDDLPALMYSIGILDIHGPANISGVLYTPSYSEIENRPNETGYDNQLQYIKGSIIVGGGLFLENKNKARTVVSYDGKALDSLSTMNSAGKQVVLSYWE